MAKRKMGYAEKAWLKLMAEQMGLNDITDLVTKPAKKDLSKGDSRG